MLTQKELSAAVNVLESGVIGAYNFIVNAFNPSIPYAVVFNSNCILTGGLSVLNRMNRS